MERRLLLAIVLVFAVLTLWQWLVPMPQPQPAPAGPAATLPAAPNAPAPQMPAPAVEPAASATPVETVQADTALRTITVDNGVVRATFTNRGATLSRWQLPHYRAADGQAVDLVPDDLPPTAPRPFALKLDDSATSARVNSGLFTVSANGTGVADAAARVDGKTSPVIIQFEYQDAAGIHVRKQFRLDPNSYVLNFSTNVTDQGRVVNPAVQWGPGLGDVLPGAATGAFATLRGATGVLSTAGDVERPAASELSESPRRQGTFDFVGVETHYFISAAVKPGAAELEYYPMSVPVKGSNPPITREYIGYDIRFTSTPAPASARFFIGPKHFETLKRVDAELVRAVWFGMFSFLTVPLLSALNWIYGFVGNYGWSILVLTFIINAAMFPLRHKSFISMRKMQAIQPQVKAIQDRYSKLKVTDPARQKMNTELMELYRQKGVNPASGCIPMVLTIPVLVAFYNLLSESIELRGAPFTLWIHDLAAYDPYYVLPILMGVSQIVQQKMTPTTGADPVQQKMMLFMPILFTFLFLKYPAGLSLYWFASNVMVIGQQVLTNALTRDRAKATSEGKR